MTPFKRGKLRLALIAGGLWVLFYMTVKLVGRTPIEASVPYAPLLLALCAGAIALSAVVLTQTNSLHGQLEKAVQQLPPERAAALPAVRLLIQAVSVEVAENLKFVVLPGVVFAAATTAKGTSDRLLPWPTWLRNLGLLDMALALQLTVMGLFVGVWWTTIQAWATISDHQRVIADGMRKG